MRTSCPVLGYSGKKVIFSSPLQFQEAGSPDVDVDVPVPVPVPTPGREIGPLKEVLEGAPIAPPKGGVKGIMLELEGVGVDVTPPRGVGVSTGVAVGIVVAVETGVLVGSGVSRTGVAVSRITLGVGVTDPARLCGDGLNERQATEVKTKAAARASTGILMLDLICSCLKYPII